MDYSTQNAEIVPMIRCQFGRGAGIEGDPYRIVFRYFTIEGRMIAEIDPSDKVDAEAVPHA